MTASGRIIGGILGGVLGLVIPLSLAGIYVWRGGDPTAAGVFSFFTLFTIPLGIGAGATIGSQRPKRRD